MSVDTETKVEVNYTDADLVALSRSGNQAAFGRLVMQYENAAFATALTYVHEHSNAEDIVQEAFVAAYCKLVQLREPDRFGWWLRSIVRTKALESLRRSHIVRMDTIEMAEPELALISMHRGDRSEEHAQLWDAVHALPAKLREVVLANYIGQSSYEQTAHYLGLPVTTVKGRLQQARIKLRKMLVTDMEALAMSTTTQEKRVEEAICKIASEDIDETIPLANTDSVVLCCGESADIEICHTDGNDVKITGTKTSLGFSEDEAQKSVDTIKVLHDQVESYLDSGPHDGEIFVGTSTPSGDQPVATYRSVSSGPWGKQDVPHTFKTFERPDIFPDIQPDDADIAERIFEALGGATRITIIREKGEDITLPQEALTEEVRREFFGNYGDGKVSHGSRGMVHLVIAVPRGKEITILGDTISGRGIRIWGLRGSINVVGQHVELKDVEGEVRLLNTYLISAQNVRGRLLQCSYQIGGASVIGIAETMERQVSTSKIRDIVGHVQLDLAAVDLELSNITGTLKVHNRYGTTRFHLKEHEGDSTYRLESDSGEIRAFIDENLIGQLHASARSICGTLDVKALREANNSSGSSGNSTQFMSYSTKEGTHPLGSEHQDVEVLLLSRSGEIRVEITK